jgi:uncharacterized membrane protein
MEGPKLTIDWTQMPTYNTVMAISAGAALISLICFLQDLHKKNELQSEAWSLAFSVPGFILTITGLHMSLTWPLAKYFPFDNIIFGETSLAFGVLLLATSFFLWKKGSVLNAAKDPAHLVALTVKPLSIFITGMGLALFAIAGAGIRFQLFAAPPEEPLTGFFAPYPWLEAIIVSGLFALVGLGAFLTPFGVKTFSSGKTLNGLHRTIGIAWGIAGVAFLLFGALNFFTHIGLIINTMPH